MNEPDDRKPLTWRKLKFEPGFDSHDDPVWRASIGELTLLFREWPNLLPKQYQGGRPPGEEGRWSAELYISGHVRFADDDGWIEWSSTPRRALAKLWRQYGAEVDAMFREAERLDHARRQVRLHFRGKR